MQRQLIILSGDRGSGKTTLCLRLVAFARQFGMSCAGLISPARFDCESKVGIDLLDVRSNERRSLAQAGERPGERPGDLRTGAFRFDTRTVQWGDWVLKEACPCDVLFVDELGPLELERGQGWTSAIDVLRKEQYQLAVVVVRPALVNVFRQLVSSVPPLFQAEYLLTLPDGSAEAQAKHQIAALLCSLPPTRSQEQNPLPDPNQKKRLD